MFSAVFLSFSRVFTGVERGQKSLVFWEVFLGFYLNTKEWKIRVQSRLKISIPEGDLEFFQSLVRDVPDTFKFLRHIMRAILSVRPKCSHRCVSLKETP